MTIICETEYISDKSDKKFKIILRENFRIEKKYINGYNVDCPLPISARDYFMVRSLNSDKLKDIVRLCHFFVFLQRKKRNVFFDYRPHSSLEIVCATVDIFVENLNEKFHEYFPWEKNIYLNDFTQSSDGVLKLDYEVRGKLYI